MRAVVCIAVLVAVATAAVVNTRDTSALPWPLTNAMHAVLDMPVNELLRNRYVLGLQTRNVEALKKHHAEISDPAHIRFGEKLTVEQIRALSDAPVEERQAVINWLVAHGFSHIQDWGDAILFVSPSKAHAMQTLLAPGVYGEDTKRVMHSELLALAVQSIEGPGMATPYVEKIYRNRNKVVQEKVKASPSMSIGIVGRQTIEYLYAVNNNTVHPLNLAASSVCAVEYLDNQGFSVKGVTYAQSQNGWSNNPLPNNHIVGPNSGENDESQLDVQIIAAVAGNQAIWFWDSTGWLLATAQEVINYSNPPWVLSNSWGWAADQQCQIITCGAGGDVAYVQQVNAAYVKLGLLKITFLAASGDAGAPGRTNEECDPGRGVVPIFPGSSPYVLSIGGTYNSNEFGSVNINSVTSPTPLCQNFNNGYGGCANGTREGLTQYNETFLPIQWTAGGGFSFDFETSGTPSWQASQVSEYLSSGVVFPAHFNRTGRAYPDVSANSNQCAVFSDYGDLTPLAGTSCATPIVAAFIGLLNADLHWKGLNPIGFVNPSLYTLHTTTPSAFNDVLPLNNGCTEYMCCPVQPDGQLVGFYSNPKAGGFDPVNGLGTPNVAAWRKGITQMMEDAAARRSAKL